MKWIIICTAMLTIGANGVIAQGPGAERRAAIQERIKAQRVAYITQRLDLTAEESAAFWPLFNEFEAEQKKLQESARPEKPLHQLTNEEADRVIEAQLDLEEEKLKLRRTYMDKFKSAIPSTKLVMLGPAVEEFNRSVLERLRKARGMPERDK